VSDDPVYFATPAAFRAWLRKNHGRAGELLVGFHKRAGGAHSMTWPESVDEALCYGWIDGVRRRVDDRRYTIRFTPRKKRSIWSAVNVKRAKELIAEGRMAPAGLAAFEARGDDRTAIYSYEQRKDAAFDPDQLRAFRGNPKAWSFFGVQAPWYRRAATHWVTSAKRRETRERRLAELIRESASGRRVRPLRRRESGDD
jgi:uncharacterized protein YdeI (YjbR/CyaY-like superfamily)